MEYAQIVFYQLVIFVIYGAIGVAAVKGGILDEAGLHPSGSMHGSQLHWLPERRKGVCIMATWRKPHTIKPDFSKQNLPDFPATKFFDQLSFVGNELVSCFILETAKGYVLLDCMNPDLASRNCIEKAFEDLGFDIHDLYAIVISHGHGDHYGCCDYFKEKYGAKLYMSRIDWEFARNMPERFPCRPSPLRWITSWRTVRSWTSAM